MTNHSEPPVPPFAVHDWRFAVDAHMAEQEVTRAELARRLGVTKSRVTQILTSNNPTVRTMAGVARALGFQMRIEFQVLTERE